MHTPRDSHLSLSKPWLKPALASAAVLALALTTACSSTPPKESEASSNPTAASATPNGEVSSKPSISATPTAELSVIATTSIDTLKKQGVELGDTVKVKDGSYPTYKVSQKAMIAQFDKKKHSGGNPAGWTTADVQAAQIAAANYMMNVVMDNPTLNDYEANKKIFSKSITEVVVAQYEKDFVDSIIQKETNQFNKDTFQDKIYTGDKSKGFRYVSDGKTPRIADISELELVSSEVWDGGIYYVYEGLFKTNIIDKDGNAYTQDEFISYGLTIMKQGKRFLIGGAEYFEGMSNIPEPVE